MSSECEGIQIAQNKIDYLPLLLLATTQQNTGHQIQLDGFNDLNRDLLTDINAHSPLYSINVSRVLSINAGAASIATAIPVCHCSVR